MHKIKYAELQKKWITLKYNPSVDTQVKTSCSKLSEAVKQYIFSQKLLIRNYKSSLNWQLRPQVTERVDRPLYSGY